MNATSHWLHGDGAANRRDADVPHTGLGYLTHQGAAFMWAGLFEMLRQRAYRNSASIVVRDALVTSAVAAAVDYTITPHRFTPGWELVLSKWPMAIGYAAMAAGFIAA